MTTHRNILGPSGMERHAWSIAQSGHKYQKYDNEPYFNHVFEVANLARMMGYGYAAVVSAALLHDSVEETSITLDRLRSYGFTDSVVAGVDAVTFLDEIDNPDGLSGQARKDRKLAKAMSTPVGHLIKFCDSSMNFAHTVSYPRGLKKDGEVADYVADYAANIAVLQQNLPTPGEVGDYIRNVDGPDAKDTTSDREWGYYRDRWTGFERDIQKQRFRKAKGYHYAAMSIMAAKMNG